jgi:hypothetical protein
MLPPDTPPAMASAEWPTMLSLYADRLGRLVEFPRMLTLAFPRF